MIQITSTQNVTAQLRGAKHPPIPTKEGFLAFSSSSLMRLDSANVKITPLEGHARSITAVALAGNQEFVVSCSADKVILWEIDSLDTVCERAGDHGVGTTIGVHLGPVHQCSISCGNEWLALCKENEIWIVLLKWRSAGLLGEVEHHTAFQKGTAHGGTTFSPTDPDILISVQDSNIFKVWDVRRAQVLHQASVLGSHRISFCAFSSAWPGLLLVGSNRGIVHVFKLTAAAAAAAVGSVSAYPSAPRILLALDLACSTNPATRNSLTSCESPNNGFGRSASVGEDSAAGAGCIVLNALLVKPMGSMDPLQVDRLRLEKDELPTSFVNHDDTLKSIFEPGAILIACSNLGISVYDVNAAECYSFLSFSDLSVGGIEAVVPFIDYAVLSGSTTEKVHCALRTLAVSRALLFSFEVVRRKTGPPDVPISMLSSQPLNKQSPLRAQMKTCGISTSLSGIYCSGSSKNKPQLKAKSSGYGLPPIALSFSSGSRILPNKSLCQPPHAKERLSGAKPQMSSHCRLLPRDKADTDLLRSWTPPLKLETKLRLEESFGAASHLAMSGDGNRLACSTKKLITVINAKKPNLDDCTSLVGHDSRVNSVAFGLDHTWLVTASDDGSCKVWDWQSKRCVLDIRQSQTSKNKKNLSGRNQILTATRSKVTQAAFYYMDHFIVQAVDSHLDLCCHRLHEDTTDEYRSKWRRVKRVDLPAQEITCFSAANRFHSTDYIVAGSSGKSLLVYDVDAEQLALDISGAHSRAPHTICPMSGSSTIAQPARMFDLVLSSAICDGVKLWDLRSARCVQKYSRHQNRAHLSGIDVSPCCRYVAVASEDKRVYLYDSRQCHDSLCKLSGFTVAVMDVAFSPCKPQLFAAGLDGTVNSYTAGSHKQK